MEGEGMVAVVRGLRDAGLAVTVVDGDKQYTLMPNTDLCQRVRDNCADFSLTHRESGAQAVDGRYTSTYQAAHCNIRPTSPPVQLSEFPPQRPNVYPGHSNFEVGGRGSGETYAYSKSNDIRGAPNWPDKGCICSPRNSHDSNAFAKSLRQYPTIPERSAEFIDRLLNSTRAKNLCKCNPRNQQSPTRLSDCSYNVDHAKNGPRTRPCDTDISVRVRNCDDSPSKEKRKDCDSRECKFPTEYDVRYLRDMSKRVKESVRAKCPFKLPACPTIRENYDCSSYNPNVSATSVNTESLAAVKMVSREVSTVPRPVLCRRTIAVPLSPTSSTAKTEGECCCVPSINSISCKFIQNSLSPLDLRPVSSSVELNRPSRNIIDDRKSKSQEEIRMADDDYKKNILELLDDLSICSKSKRYVRNELVKQLINTEKPKGKYIKRVKNYLKLTNRSNQLGDVANNCDHSKMCVDDEHPLLCIDGTPVIISDCELDAIIKQWVSNINIKHKDFLGRNLNRDVIIKTVSQRIKTLISNKSIPDNDLKSEILSVLEDVPINSCCDMRSYINGQIDILFHRLSNTLIQSCNIHKNCEEKPLLLKKKATFLSDHDLKNLVRETLMDFLEGSDMEMCENLMHSIENELVDLLIDSFIFIKYGDDVYVRNEVVDVLKDVGQLTHNEASHITNALFHNLKRISNEYCFHNTYTIYHSHSKQDDTDFSISPINEVDLGANLDRYTNQLCEQIDDWLNNLNMPQIQDTGFRQVVINDLAGDIVDRHKYLELNPHSRATDSDELENLRYQIFKWINKLVGDDNTETLQHAEELMKNIKSVPVPMLTNPQGKILSSQSRGCCKSKIAACRAKNRTSISQSNINHSRNSYTKRGSINAANRPSVLSSHAEHEHIQRQQNSALNVDQNWDNHQISSTIGHPSPLRQHMLTHQNLQEHNRLLAQALKTSLLTDSGKYCCPHSHSLSHRQSRIPVPIPPCCTGNSKSINKMPSIKDLNDEYDNYVKEWIQQIPITVTNQEEQQFANMARLGIHNGIWKAITKLKLDPAILNNPVYFQDMFDAEIEELLGLLPQTQELEQNKHRLKAQLIQKTTEVNEKIIAAIPSCYKQQLIDSLNNHLPKTSRLNASIKENEECLVNDLVEDYILFIRFKDVDDIKSNVYKISFLRKIEELADNLQKRSFIDSKDQIVDSKVHVTELINAVSKVPVPDNAVLMEDANEILLAIEVDSWLSAIPLKTNFNPLEKLCYRDTITKRVIEIGNHMNLSDCSARIELHKFVPKYIEKLPLQDGTDVSFLIEELANRLRNLPRDEIKRRVSFQEPQDYGEFSRDMPGCSSYIGPAENSEYESSYMIIGGEIVRNPEPKSWLPVKDSAVSEQQWLSMEETKAPSPLLTSSRRESRFAGRPLLPERSAVNQSPYGQALPTQVPTLANSPGASYAVTSQAPIPGSVVQGMNVQANLLSQSQRSAHESLGHQNLSNVQDGPELQGQGPLYSPAIAYSNTTQNYQVPGLIPSTHQTVITAQQMPRQPNLQQMAGGGGMGILGVSQVAGPSSVTSRAAQTPIQHLPTTQPRTPEYYLSTDGKGIQRIIDQNNSQRQTKTSAVSMTDPAYVVGPAAAAEAPGSGLYVVGPPISNISPTTATPLVITQPTGFSTPQVNSGLPPDVYSTPQQPISQGIPERPQKKLFKYREVDRPDRRRLDLEDSEYDTENERDDSPKPRDDIRTVPDLISWTLETVHRESQIGEIISLETTACKTKSQSTPISLINCKYKPQAKNKTAVAAVSFSEELKTSTNNSNERHYIANEDDLQLELKEWLEIQSDKLKVKIWWDKLQRLALKLKNPGEEERLRKKIEKYLETAPSAFSDDDEEKLVFRQHLPNYIMKKLKKMYLKSPYREADVCKKEMPKFYSRCKIDLLKKTLLHWLKNIKLKNKDFIGRSVKIEDILNHVVDKLEPLVLDRPKYDSEYKDALIRIVTNIVNDLPIVIDNQNKEYYLKKITNALIKDILNIDAKIPITYIQPTIAEIKQFVKEQITFLLEKSRTAISTKRMGRLEIELTDQLIDLMDVKDVDSSTTVDNIKSMLRDIAKLPEEKATYFTNIIVTDYKEFFFRQHYFDGKSNIETQPDICTEFLNNFNQICIDPTDNLKEYKQQLIELVDKWFTDINSQIKDKSYKDILVKDIASDILDRFRYLQINPHCKGTNLEELEHLKYQIFKRTNHLGREYTTLTIQHIKELMKLIRQMHMPSSFNIESNISNLQLQRREDEAYLGIIIDEIWDWFQKLPIDVQGIGDNDINRQLIKNTLTQIERNIKNKEFETIEKELDDWARNMFNGNLNRVYVDELKNKIKSTQCFKKCIIKKLEKYPKQKKITIRKYEDIIDEWIDTLPLESRRKDSFINIRNKIAHDLAANIYECEIKSKTNNTNNNLRGKILNFMNKLPLDLQNNKPTDRYKYAMELLQNIEASAVDMCSKIKPKEVDDDTIMDKLENTIYKWLRKVYLNSNQNKALENHERVINQLAYNLKRAIYNGDNVDDTIIEHLNKMEVNQSKEFIENAAIQLRQGLQNLNVFEELSLRNSNEDNLLVANIEAWLKKLPIDITQLNNDFEIQKNNFIKNIKRIKSMGFSDEKIIKEIMKFMKLLPTEISSKQDEKYLNEKADLLMESLTARKNFQEELSSGHAFINTVGDAIRDWAKLLPIEPEYDPRELKQVIEEMTTVVTAIVNHPGRKVIENQYQKTKQEIIKYLKRLPLRHECITDQRMSKMTYNLAKNLKNTRFNSQDNNIERGNVNKSNVTVYGFSVNNKSDEFRAQSTKTDDENIDLETYTRQVVNQINDWLNDLNLQINQDEGFKNVVINDLAGDIVDRYKYLELNPQSRKSPKDELEQLKYQIFKWVNKLVGDENIDTITHADDLMKRIQNIPAPIINKHQNITQESAANTKNNISKNIPVTKEDVDKLPTYGPTTSGGSFSREPIRSSFKRTSGPGKLGIPRSSEAQPQFYQNPKEAIFEKYQRIFKEKVYELPIDTPTPESAKLAQLARTAMYNGIIKTFFRLKADSDMNNDNAYFELILEDKLDEMLDVLPQTDELKSSRHAWKLSILSNATDMLKELQNIDDRASFQQKLKEGFNRKFIKDSELQQCFVLQQGFLAEVAKVYILETRYEEKDPIKANVYKQRLMKKIDELVNHLIQKHNTQFRFFKKEMLYQLAMNALGSVPVPQDDILDEEVAVILLAEEIANWYKELPIAPYKNDIEELIVKRMIDLLAKELYEIEKNENELDISKERLMKHEMSKFLVERVKLVQSEDLNINFMVDELNNRLKNMKLKDITYGGFEKNQPVCSTFAEIDNAEILAPLIDAPAATEHGTSAAPQAPGHTVGGQTEFDQDYPSRIGPKSNLPPNICPGYNMEIKQTVHDPLATQPVQKVAQDRSQPLQPAQASISQAYQRHSQASVRRRDVSRPGPPPNTPKHEAYLDPSQVNIRSQAGVTLQGSGQMRFPPTTVQGTNLRPNQVGTACSITPSAPPQIVVSRPGSPKAHIGQRRQNVSPRGTSPFRPNLGARQLLPNNEYTQQRQGVHRRNAMSPQRRRPGIINPEMVQDYVPDERQATYRSHPGNRICRNFPADFGIPCPVYAEDMEDQEEGRERIVIRCRCMEGLRRRRRVCLDSLPCPPFSSPCRYFYN